MNARILDRRSYKICRLRIQERKTFGEIAVIFNLTADRVEQIYRAAVRRIDLRQRHRTDLAQKCLSVRALHALDKTFNTTEVTRAEVLQALRKQRLHPYFTKNYGWKTHQEICQWAGLFTDQPAELFSREIKNPENWATGGEPSTGAQRRYLKALCDQAHESFDRTLTKAEASKRIGRLQRKPERAKSPIREDTILRLGHSWLELKSQRPEVRRLASSGKESFSWHFYLLHVGFTN